MTWDPLLSVRHLETYFPIREGLFSRTKNYVHAVEDVSFHLSSRETFSLVGESGCGKSTTGLSLLRLIPPTGGKILFEGENLLGLEKEALRRRRKDMQMIFQNPYASLNPRMTVYQLLEEPLKTHFSLSAQERREQVEELCAATGLQKEHLERYPHQFSGGQRQRISIARAIICKPKLVVADEPVSALDVSVQSQILNLLMKLQEDFRLSYLFISHDLNVVRHVSKRIGVMYLGRIVEQGTVDQIYSNPLHPYTKALLSAVPIKDPLEKKQRIHLKGDVPSPVDPPSGCAFHGRCPYVMEMCTREVPSSGEIEPRHQVFCHLYKV